MKDLWNVNKFNSIQFNSILFYSIPEDGNKSTFQNVVLFKISYAGQSPEINNSN
jgi:hypothetical protein